MYGAQSLAGPLARSSSRKYLSLEARSHLVLGAVSLKGLAFKRRRLKLQCQILDLDILRTELFLPVQKNFGKLLSIGAPTTIRERAQKATRLIRSTVS